MRSLGGVLGRPLIASVGPLLVWGVVEEREDVGGPFLQSPSEGSDLGQAGRDGMGEFGDQGLHPGSLPGRWGRTRR